MLVPTAQADRPDRQFGWLAINAARHAQVKLRPNPMNDDVR